MFVVPFSSGEIYIMKLFRSASNPVETPPAPAVPQVSQPAVDPTTLQTATFGAGCFWGVEEAFRQVNGVVSTAVGFAGGTTENPSYKDVCRGRTGHAEVVKVVFDPSKVSYEQLLEVFWSSHNPTTRDRQGWDIGSQYRSAIFVHNPEQEESARRSLGEMDCAGRYKKPIVTEITPAGPFYRAEEYHQQYLAKRGQGACHI
jgi:peptide-methionine (S)-S-oxide reductase